eukprot:TRINITY_DN10522_c1_g1_i1.p1 TRINITY_DN10522_c1_g1~~TRINITY_DN10522_c1_g1_i1.p1  ORF type:complete len:544 (-),score=98.46 TRINITY_DN10522_c1_g1_i1:56-1687(-)
MKKVGLLSFLLLTLLFDQLVIVESGYNCVSCVLIVRTVQQYSVTHETSVDKALEELCSFLPAIIQGTCEEFIQKYGSTIINMLGDDATPDQVCQTMEFCPLQCSLYTKTHPDEAFQIHKEKFQREFKKFGGFDPWEWIKQQLNEVYQSHIPPRSFDVDNDKFASGIETLRGSNWRGQDCNDNDNTIHAGRKVTSHPPSVDHNCNGIYGTVPGSGHSYETLLCNNTQQYGVVVLGASAQAHFEIPVQWIEAATINSTTYDNVLEVLEDEFDLPHLSWVTGFDQSVPYTSIDSLYLKLRGLNYCNHRDYQSISHNGAGSDQLPSLVKTFYRNQTLDQPVLFVLATIGDDICGEHNTTDRMTTPEEFEKNILMVLDYLDTVLPSGSHVLFSGLVDGRILYDTLHNVTHPLGGVDYAQLYEWLSCLGANPCWIWLNSNETIRNIGSARAAELSGVFDTIIGNYTFNNFDMGYIGFPLQQIIQQWNQQGGNTIALIEPVDGFHPSTITHRLLADYIWNWIETNQPSWVPKANPNNDAIQKIFGDQGGY